ncbi:MAG TPA: hypothetical protein VFX59_12360 [Polyangiales bacterium]|nr:hypothetical protein [Polyangiales bacterium]
MEANDEHAVRTVPEYLRLAAQDEMKLRTTFVAEGVWLELLRQEYSKEAILLHKKLPIRVLDLLSSDADEMIRAAVAEKRAAAPLLATLANDGSSVVRARVARNAKARREVLEQLVADPEPHVANAARERLGLELIPEPAFSGVVIERQSDEGEDG